MRYPTKLGGGNTGYTRDNKGQSVEERLPGIPNYTPYYYLFDGLGSVVGLTDGAGTVVNTYSYEPYGKIRTSTGTVANTWLFASGYLDAQTGFYKFGMRYYDPSVARWIQQDSKPHPNLYSYVADDPINKVDPTGADLSVLGCDLGTAFGFVGGSELLAGGVDIGNTVVTDANSNVTTHCYDNQGRVIKALDAKNQAAATSYTSDNNVQTYSDAANPSSPTSFTYAPTTNNLTNAAEPTGANQTWGYKDCANDPQTCNTDPSFYPDTYLDAQGNRYTYGYSSSNNLTSVKNNSSGANWNATYNSNGTVATNKDANGNVTSYTYDGVGNLTRITYPAPLGAINMTYDSLSRMLTRTDGKGQLTQYAYDVMDRLTQITYADNSTIVYSYDNDGNTTQLQDNTGTTTFTYDSMNRQTKKVLPGATTMTYAYDGIGNLTSLQDPGGTVTYGYDAVNELTSLQEPNGSSTTFAYNAGYRRTSTAYPNGVSEGMTYDSSERLTQIKATKGPSTLNSFTYSYISAVTQADSDLRWSVTDGNNSKTSYNYDVLNHLTGASNPTSTYAYSYDPNGNRCRDDSSGCANPAYAYNAANELTSHAGTTYSYDANGNETGNSTGLSLSYNPKDQTTAGNGLSMTYTGATQTERVTAGSTNFTYNVLGCGGASAGVASNTGYTRDNKGQLVEERIPGVPNYTPYYYLFDGLGSVVGLTDGSGNVDTYSYEPYGKLASSTGSVANPWLFAGGYFDSLTGLYKFGMRYYDPAVGRWTQEDSQPGSNLFTYVNDNPVNTIDLTGANAGKACVIGMIGGGIGSTVAAGLGALLLVGLGIATLPEGVGVLGFVAASALVGGFTGEVGGCITGAIVDWLTSIG